MIDINFWNNKKVLITGYSGFKGYWLSLLLNQLGSNVLGISKDGTSSEIFTILNGIKTDSKNKNLDIVNSEKVNIEIKNIEPDVIFHFAAQSLVISSQKNPKETLETNILGTFNVLNSLNSISKRVACIVATTDKVYKNPGKLNKESDELGSFEYYGASKVSVEHVVNSYNNDINSINKVTIVRSGNVLGGGDGGHNRILTDILYSINNKKELVLRNPSSIRPWQFVLDSVGGYLLTAQENYQNNQSMVYNLNSPEINEVTVEILSEKLIKRFDSGVEISFHNSNKYKESDILRIDSSKAQKELGWKTFYSIDDIVENIYLWENSKISGSIISETNRQITEYLSRFSS